MKFSSCVLTLFTSLILATSVEAQYHKYDVWEENYTVQALLGAVQFENLKFTPIDSAEPVEVDHSLLPQLGGAWSTLPKGDRFQVGLETSFLLGFRFDKVNYASIGGSGLYVSLSTSMWMVDISGGGYANLFLDKNHTVRLYGGVGPLMEFASYRTDRDYNDDTPSEDDTESAFGIGLYARTGIEFRTQQKGMLGLGVRGTWSDVDFTDVGGRSELVGVAVFVSYTAGF